MSAKTIRIIRRSSRSFLQVEALEERAVPANYTVITSSENSVGMNLLAAYGTASARRTL